MKKFATAAVLAGGKSTRMGYDKQQLHADGAPLRAHVCADLRRVFGDILVVTYKPALYANENVRLCMDCYRDMGPLAGIHAALSNSQSEYVYILACDMPVVNLDYISFLKDRLLQSGAQICVTRRNGRIEPFNGFYSVQLLPDLQSRLERGDSSLFHFITAADADVVPEEHAKRFDRNLAMFTNINTGAEFDAYLRTV